MKNFHFILFISLLIFSCSDPTGNDSTLLFDQETGFKSGDIKTNSMLTITLDSVTSDSRCPTDVNCVWEGNASVRFIVNIDNTDHEVTLNTHGGNNFPNDTTLGIYSIAMNDLLPYPESTSSIPQEDYEARLVIKTLED